jgi:hypothetical protein
MLKFMDELRMQGGCFSAREYFVITPDVSRVLTNEKAHGILALKIPGDLA